MFSKYVFVQLDIFAQKLFPERNYLKQGLCPHVHAHIHKHIHTHMHTQAHKYTHIKTHSQTCTPEAEAVETVS